MSQGPIFPPVRGPRDDEPNGDNGTLAAPGADGHASPTQPSEQPVAPQATPAQAAPSQEPAQPQTRAEARAQAQAERAGQLEETASHPFDPVGDSSDPGDNSDSETNSPLVTDGDEPTETGEDEADENRRRIPWWAWVLIGVGVAAVIAAIVIAVVSRGSSEPAPTVTVTAAAPTPTGTPIEKGEGSALYDAIPDVTNQFVLTSLVPNEAWVQEREALEAYDAVYEGPASLGDGTVQLQVTIGQWPSSDDAITHATSLTGSLVGVNTNLSDVLAFVQSTNEDEAPEGQTAQDEAADEGSSTDGNASQEAEAESASDPTAQERVGGLWAPIDGLAQDDSPGALVWTNDTVVITLQGPSNELQRFYDGYGL
ncbi:hypothetical protein SAMN06309944_1351 [Micrococcales bacterium KH10]|nr:hypothetical protein SAMN06309944_1351 [Micrococcales bacterium KH10]